VTPDRKYSKIGSFLSEGKINEGTAKDLQSLTIRKTNFNKNLTKNATNSTGYGSLFPSKLYEHSPIVVDSSN